MILSNKLRKWRPVRARQHWALLKRAREHGLSKEELSYLESPEDMIAGPADLLEAAIEWATEIEDKRRSRWLQVRCPNSQLRAFRTRLTSNRNA